MAVRGYGSSLWFITVVGSFAVNLPYLLKPIIIFSCLKHGCFCLIAEVPIGFKVVLVDPKI